MKTILPLLLLIFVVSCSHTKPAKQAAAEAHFNDDPQNKMKLKAGPLDQGPIANTETNTPAANVAILQDFAPATTPTNKTVIAEVPSAVPLDVSTNGAQRVTPPRALRVPPGNTNLAITASVGPEPTPAPAPAEDIISAGMIDFRNAPLEGVLKLYAELVNRTLLRPAALPAPQITLTTQTQLTKSEAIRALDAVLGMNGITMITVDDKFVKAVPQPQALTEGARPDTRPADQLPDFGAFVTHVVQLKYVKPSEVVPALQPFAKMNSILPIDSSQIIVIRDYTENVKRMLEMIDRIDIMVPGEFVSEVIPIKYAKASEIADALNSLSGSGGGGGTSVGSRSSGTGARPAVGNSANSTRPGGIGGYTPGGGVGQTGAFGGAGGATGAPGSSFSDRLQQIIRKASTSGDLQILGQTKMIADERSNSLLIFASRQDLDMIKSVVAKLDVVLAQVLIETVIMDVTLQNANAFGVSAIQTEKNFTSDIAGAGGMNASKFFNFTGKNDSGTTNAVTDLLGSGLRYFGKLGNDYYVQIQAAASQGRVNVIQKPRILTSHATPGSIFVGSTVPYVTSTYYGGGYGGGPSSSYQQLQVGIGLTVTPFINPDGLVVMTIDEEISELAGSTEIQGVGAVPNTTSRKLSAEVAVRDGDSIILGGFIRNATTKNNSGVPLLKDIPLLGALFSSRSSTKDRTELLVLMRPTVLKTPDIAALASTQEKKRLPGVSAAEAEVNEQERNEQMAEQQRQAKRDAKAAARNQNGSVTNSPDTFKP